MNNVIVAHYAGSISYGTNIASSDVDIRGIFCPDKESFINPFIETPKEIELENEEDGKLYELSNYLELLRKANPNILETLWVDDRFILESSSAFELLRSKRDMFLTSKVAFTFSSYAYEQINRMRSHNKWINNPQAESAPIRKDYLKIVKNISAEEPCNIDTLNTNNALIRYKGDMYGVIPCEGQSILNQDGSLKVLKTSTDINPTALLYLDDKGYRTDKKNHENYWNWVNNRNVKRSENEIKFGYDTKNAMHLVRLMRMAEEMLTSGEVNVFRKDAKELLDIRNGSMTFEEVLQYSKDMDEKVKVLYNKSELPPEVDYSNMHSIWKELTDLAWS